MSNHSLIVRIRQKVDALRHQQASHIDLARSLRGEGGSLESLPYPLVKEIERLGDEFEIAQWYIEGDCLPNTANLIAQTEKLLDTISALTVHHH